MDTLLPPTIPQGAAIRDRERAGYDRVAPTYSAATRELLRETRARLLDRAALEPGHAVLDVCSGPGWLTLETAAAVGPTGRVVGIDLSPGAVAQAEANAQEAGIHNVSFAVMDAETLEFEDASFDRVLCSFGLMHVPGAGQAAQEMARVLRPGGRIVLTVWGAAGEAAFLALLAESLRTAAGGHLPLDPSYALRLGPPGVLEGVLESAEFRQVVIERVNQALSFPDGATFWDRFRLIGGLFSALLEELPPETVASARAGFMRRAAIYQDGEILRLPAGYLLAAAMKS